MSGYGVAQEGSEEREYCLQVFYTGQQKLPQYLIHVVITWNIEAHITMVKEEFGKMGAVLGLQQPVEFESDKIFLDIPMEGLSIMGWKITPLSYPMVTKKQVDNFRAGELPPCCQLKAKFSGNRTTLKCQVTLQGAKYPHNVFTIDIPAEDPSSQSAQTFGDLAIIGDKSNNPQFKDLLRELNSKITKWEDTGTLLGIEEGQLRWIKSDNGGDSKACLRERLNAWMKQNVPSPSWSAIVKAIDVLGHQDMATNLRTKYICDESTNNLSQVGGSVSGQGSLHRALPGYRPDAHILTKEELQVLSGLLAPDGEENQIRQSIQHGQAEGLTLEEVQRILQDRGKIDAANELKDKLRKGVENMKHFETYEQALRGNKILWMQYLKFVLFGPPRSGKSSTRRRLIKEINNLRSIGGGSKSTGLAHSSEILIKKATSSPAAIVISDDDRDSDWRSLQGSQTSGRNQTEQKADLRYLAQVFYNCILRMTQPSSSCTVTLDSERHKSNNPPLTSNQEQIQKLTSDILDTGHEIEKELLDDEIERAFEELTSILQSDSPEELQKLVENLIMINIIDVGGQPAFLEILPTFSIGSALYLLFFRMDQDPKKLYPVRFKEHEDDEETILDSFYCIEDVLCQSLSCVASLGYTHSSSELTVQQSVSRALLFGTYKDEVEKQGTESLEVCVSKINKDLWKKLSSIKEDLLLPANAKDNFFQVDNMEGNDDINKIRKEIEKIVCSVYPSIPVPPSWLMFRILLHLLDKPIIDLDRCRVVASKFMMSTPVEEAIWFFHHHVGSLMHFPEIDSMKNVVICNPQVIFDSISEVIISTFSIENREIPESAVKEFKRNGQFTFEHIECSTKEQRQSCLSPKQLIDVLKYHHIIAEIKAENEDSQSSPKYIIPAVLNSASEEDLNLLEGERSESKACPLMIWFECGFVPLGVFCAGVSYLIAHQQEKDWILHKGYEVKKNKVTFLVEGTYVVGFISRPKYLEIQVKTVPRASSNRKSLSEMCLTVKQTIVGALDAVIWQMKQKTMFQGAREPLFHLSIAFSCTQCSANDDGHLMKVIENEGQCLHERSRHDLQKKHLIWFGQSEKTTSECTSSRLPPHQQFSPNLQSQTSEGIGSQTGLSVEEAADRAGVGLDVLLKECSDAVSLDLASFCVHWKLIGRRFGLTEADLAAVYGDNWTEEERRIGMLKKWKSKLAYKATYQTFVKALLAEGRNAEAIEACEVIKAAEDVPVVPVKPELRDLLKELYSTKAADKWEDIGIMLGIKTGDLDTIKTAGNQTSQSCLREMLKLYLRKDNPPPSWAAIVEALESLGEETLAAKIKSKHCSNQRAARKGKYDSDEQETPEARETNSQRDTRKRKYEYDEQETPEAKKTKK